MQVSNLNLVEDCFRDAQLFIKAHIPRLHEARYKDAREVASYTSAVCTLAEYLAVSKGGTTLETHAIIIARLVTRDPDALLPQGYTDDGN